ncbi:MAG: response regulator [Nitrospiraceae bacterium]|jgi:CheY-like chemotaxis protein|uniref:response regulator transcription factor n=1 Tax=Nitrospira cf. moscoviensis SBR1015 TaxID=96242 RepID=UPI000A0A8CFF|nr:response regulator [Nitrospira cf. moscoviensis SBR1015]MBY0247110.1 response regulator [Nitrospiraceae bacterium]OQW31108.1 MAG: hypothetical protein A4E20_15105 [Nitrospira sp. SG-bin2]
MAKKKILIIDDHADTRLLVGARLKKHGYDTVFAADALQAITAARQAQPDAIILDLGLPGGNGINWTVPVLSSHGQLTRGSVSRGRMRLASLPIQGRHLFHGTRDNTYC